jgi:signal transduction histidine kinase
MARRTAALAWVVGGISLALITASVVFLILALPAPLPEASFGFRGFGVVIAVSFGTVGLVLATRRPDDPIGWVLLITGGIMTPIQEIALGYAMYTFFVSPGALPGGDVAAWVNGWIWVPILGALALVLLYIPNGRLPSPRWRWVAVYLIVTFAIVTVATALVPGPLETFREATNPLGVGSRSIYEVAIPWSSAAYGLGLVLVAASLVVRTRRATGEERVQLRWIASAALLLPLAFVPYSIVYITDARASGPLVDALELLMVAAIVATAVAIGVAVLKYRLYDIDIVITRAVVVGLLGAFITAVYVGVVVGMGALIGQQGDPLLSALAAAFVALAFQPVRRRARHVADRIVYGERATPYEVLADFSARLGGAYETDDVLPRMASVLGEGTGAERADVWLRVGEELRPVATWPASSSHHDALVIDDGELPPFPDANAAAPVRHRGELLGALTVAKPASEPITPAEERLVHDLALQAGFVLRNVRLVEELRASRQRLVRAQDEERRKLERDIHDGAQQQLVALAVKVRLADAMVDRDAARAHELLAEVQAETTETLEALRDLARGIFPPLLADQGLTVALEAQARKAALPIVIVADGVGRFPPDVEAAAYFCCLEALQNAAKYAEAGHVELALMLEGSELRFEIRDDGRGFDPHTTPRGSGLQNMSDRLEALGGRLEIRSAPGEGTITAGRIPVPGGLRT